MDMQSTDFLDAHTHNPNPKTNQDAVVVMHLFRAALAGYHKKAHAAAAAADDAQQQQQQQQSPPPPPRPRLIYFEQATEFPEVKQLVADTAREYDLDLRTYANVGFAQGLKACIDGEGGGAMAFLLGTRKVICFVVGGNKRGGVGGWMEGKGWLVCPDVCR